MIMGPAGLKAVTRHAFETLKLHRLEANIQPGNDPVSQDRRLMACS
jgi:RimJ/RimL family protein N-acetyltransferase